MESAKLTVRLSKKDLEFARQYARAHRITMTELISRYLRSLQASEGMTIHPEVEKISGLIPADVDTLSVRRHRGSP